MALDSSGALVALLRTAGLVDAARLDLLEGDLTRRFPRARDLGRHLLQRDWLTAFQVNQLLQDNAAGLNVGPYLLLERLGAGGMGEVFRARHRRCEHMVALKVIRKERLGQ